jgi:hypothetical protein
MIVNNEIGTVKIMNTKQKINCRSIKIVRKKYHFLSMILYLRLLKKIIAGDLLLLRNKFNLVAKNL